ncbi:MAG TPA: FUSC family protein, partial [Trinickia sp.]|nr:FUSC family protein [Trinickia sp.]
RYLLARNLRECARLYTRIATGTPINPGEQLGTFAGLGERLVKQRSLMPSVAKEIDVPLERLEEIQRLHRSLISALEMIAAAALAAPADPGRAASAAGAGKREPQTYAVRATLLAMARALRFGSDTRVRLPADGRWPPGATAIVVADAQKLSGPEWLAQRFVEQVDQLRALLAETEARWNIERRTTLAMRRQ